ncbi:LrgB family protein [Clostridium swellfunianum]|uniref:LrgB family protein n=1 Tax=Clostridium swellfunianum TaxID=1367462 RepID=UPI00202FFF2B|nr:LrgB family protein [Clostridium swellfunianum]MCM0646923.1 LrgB family protein [Clostridium swellfunianum]
MRELFDTPLFGIMISLLTFEIGVYLNKKTKKAIFNPLLISQSLIILFLIKFNISVESYNKGGQLISFFLAPATVILAVPLYRKIKLLKENAAPILIGITAGSVAGMVSVILLGKLFGLQELIKTSMIAKSVTAPIGIEISNQIGGVSAITVAAIIITGIFGAVAGDLICKLLRIKDKVAVGTAIGTAAHALGTTKAMELGETEGAMSSLSIGVAGLITVVLAPVMVKLFL